MPTYVYRRADGSTFNVFQSIKAEPLKECPTTQQPCRRVISGGVGFIFKGSGFYQTDYVAKPKEKAESDAATNGESAKDKPAAKEEKAEAATAD